MDNEILWEKWRDPFLGYDENDLDPDHSSDQAIINAINQFPNHNNDDEDGDEQISNQVHKDSNNIRVIATPMGIIPYNEFTASGKIFNFWTGHTNFKITEDVFNIMEETLGVEVLDVFTPYRFRIAVGKAFEATIVKQNIRDKICDYLKK
jgi:hypothetical protein